MFSKRSYSQIHVDTHVFLLLQSRFWTEKVWSTSREERRALVGWGPRMCSGWIAKRARGEIGGVEERNGKERMVEWV